jgi:hypothetical protein
LEIGKGERRDAQPEQPPAIGAILSRWRHWNGGPPEIGKVDDGVSKRLEPYFVRWNDQERRHEAISHTKLALAAYGDSILPQIAEAIGRSILRMEADRD